MKTSTKFWLTILGLTFIGLQFTQFFRETEIIIIAVVLFVYIIFCFCQLFLYLLELENIDKDFLKVNFLYWILYLPITKFNNWLNSL